MLEMANYDFAVLKQFRYERVLNEGTRWHWSHQANMKLDEPVTDSITHALTLLGTLPVGNSSDHAQAIVRIEKTALTADQAEQLLPALLKDTKLIEGTDIVRAHEIVVSIIALQTLTSDSTHGYLVG